MTLAPNAEAISTVLSVEPESTTTISFAQRTLSRVRRRLAASFFVMMATERVFPIHSLLLQRDGIYAEVLVDKARHQRLEQSAVLRQDESSCFIGPIEFEAGRKRGDPYLAHWR